jgi:uncharacterized protein (TIGR00255 family)
MISMTGYAYREKTEQDLSVSVEIKGYNSRFLEIFINLPPWLSMLEGKIKELLSSRCGRGKIEIGIRVREHNASVNIGVNTKAAKAYYDAANAISNELNIDEKPSLSLLLGLEGVLEIEKNRDDERYWQEIQPLLDEALNIFIREKEREGAHTQDNILSNLEKIEKSLIKIASFAPLIENTIKENIKTRFAEVLGNQIDENRILAETASLLVKYTISEEISRLGAHLKEFRTETQCHPRSGKKLDFLSQEMNREINTIGSKSAIIEVSGSVVQMKEALENIREQLRNVE